MNLQFILFGVSKGGCDDDHSAMRSAKSRVSSELLEGLALAKSGQCRLLNCTGWLDKLDGEVAILTQPPVGRLALT